MEHWRTGTYDPRTRTPYVLGYVDAWWNQLVVSVVMRVVRKREGGGSQKYQIAVKPKKVHADVYPRER
jgi:hypothetical protein